MLSHMKEAATIHRCCCYWHQLNVNTTKELTRRKIKRCKISNITKDKNNNKNRKNNRNRYRSDISGTVLLPFVFLVLNFLLMQHYCIAEMMQVPLTTTTTTNTSVNSEKISGSLVNSTLIVNSGENDISQNQAKKREMKEINEISRVRNFPTTPVVKRKFRRKYAGNQTHQHQHQQHYHYHQHAPFYKGKRRKIIRHPPYQENPTNPTTTMYARRYQQDVSLLTTARPTIPKTTIQHSMQQQQHQHQHYIKDTNGRKFVQVQEQHQAHLQQKIIAPRPTSTASVTVQWQTQTQQEYVHQQHQHKNLTHIHQQSSERSNSNRKNHVLVQGNTDIVLYRNVVGPLPCPPGIRLVPHRLIPLLATRQPQQQPHPRQRGKKYNSAAPFPLLNLQGDKLPNIPQINRNKNKKFKRVMSYT